jgi:hypothetical protein
MKAIIWIIVVALLAWGVWWFVSDDDVVVNNDTAGEVNGDTDTFDADVDLGEFDSKG